MVKASMKTCSRNTQLSKGVMALSRTAMFKKSHRWSTKKGAVAPQAAKPEPVAAAKEPRFYSADRVIKKLPSRRSKQNPTKLRSSITPGTVMIMLAGRFKGKRVVFVKQLKSGLLLVTGPFHLNGVPLRQVSQAYVLATSTKIDIANVDASKVDDAFFAKSEQAATKESDEFFGAEKEEKKVSSETKAIQKEVDAAVMSSIGKNTVMKSYLRARFSLTKGQFPHLMKF